MTRTSGDETHFFVPLTLTSFNQSGKNMLIQFNTINSKIEYNTLTLADIIEKTLEVDSAIREILPEKYRNPGIQGFFAWAIIHEYLNPRRNKLPKFLEDFVDEITRVLETSSNVLSLDFNAPVSSHFRGLYEKDIKIKGLSPFIKKDYSEEEIDKVKNALKESNLLNENSVLPSGVLVYRIRDGRFYVVTSEKNDLIPILCNRLNLKPDMSEIRSFHITLTEGQNCTLQYNEIIKKYKGELLTAEIAKSIGFEPQLKDINEYVIFPDIRFNDITITNLYSGKMPTNQRISSVDALGVSSEEILAFKNSFDFPKYDKPFHVTIGASPRIQAPEILQLSEKESVLDFLEPNNPFIVSLKHNIEKIEITSKDLIFSSINPKNSKQEQKDKVEPDAKIVKRNILN